LGEQSSYEKRITENEAQRNADKSVTFNVNTVRELLSAHGLKASKSKGQNFLTDANIPDKLVRLSGIDQSCGVLEVGPGLGALTLALSRVAGRVTAIELDNRLMPILFEVLKEQSNVELVQGDVLKTDLKKLVFDRMPGLRHHVCANLPYNITSPAISAFIEAGVFETITVMVQREVAHRICASPGTPEYGAFTVYVNYHTEPQMLFDVPPECFTPRPGVHSSVVKMVRRLERPLKRSDEELFFRVVRAAFGQRRKTLVNALYSTFGSSHDKAAIGNIVESCGFGVCVRGETLSVEEFIRISAHFK
jgi:16S rRNA (adenine1518-N6/adenine1519-N6)-dimethyltransferase